MRSKLAAIVVVPTIALLVAAIGGVSGQVERGSDAGAVGDLAQVGQQVTALVHQLQRERDVTAGWLAADRRDEPAAVAGERAAVDVAVSSFGGSVAGLGPLDGQAGRLLATADTRLASLPVLRSAVSETALPGKAVFGVYTSIISDLLALIDEIGRATTDRALAEPVRALDALARAKEFSSQQRGLLVEVLSAPVPRPDRLQAFLSAADQERGALAEFRSVAAPEQRRRHDDTVTGPEVDQTERIKAAVVAGQGRAALGSADAWLRTATAKLDLMVAVERALLEEVTAASAAARDRTLRDGASNVAWVLLAIVAALAVMWLAARSLAARLDALRGGALTVANVHLPAAVARIQAAARVDLADIGVAPISVAGSDEVGDVARAFDKVGREAVRLAGEQALLQAQTATVFTNMARRSQGLVERQIRLMDTYEKDERDPDRLSQLYEVDHLATRMRRQNESLLVLAGADTPRAMTQPQRLEDVLRAAVGEVEQYQRVRVGQTEDVLVAGYLVSDLVHLLAELLENATSFSSAATEVTVTGRRFGAGEAMIEVDDQGFGMDSLKLGEANKRLSEPPALGPAAVQSMGLYVVGRLADRHGVKVQLRRSSSNGVLALVRVPQAGLVAASAVRPVTGLGRGHGQSSAGPVTAGRLGLAEVTAELRTLTSQAATGDPLSAAMWQTDRPLDVGWQVAAAATTTPSFAEQTPAGLPRRRAGENAVPGSIGRHTAPDSARLAGGAPPVDALERGQELARFQNALKAGQRAEQQSRQTADH